MIFLVISEHVLLYITMTNRCRYLTATNTHPNFLPQDNWRIWSHAVGYNWNLSANCFVWPCFDDPSSFVLMSFNDLATFPSCRWSLKPWHVLSFFHMFMISWSSFRFEFLSRGFWMFLVLRAKDWALSVFDLVLGQPHGGHFGLRATHGYPRRRSLDVPTIAYMVVTRESPPDLWKRGRLCDISSMFIQ